MSSEREQQPGDAEETARGEDVVLEIDDLDDEPDFAAEEGIADDDPRLFDEWSEDD